MCLRYSVVLTLLCAALVAEAQPDLSPLQRPSRPMREAAQQHYASGSRFFEEGQWDAALVEFEASWRLSGERDLLHNISWTHEKAGRAREALDYAERYLTASRGTEDEDRATKRVAFLKQRYGESASGAASSAPVVVAPVVTPPAQNAASGATAAPSTAGNAKPPGLAIGLLAGGGVLALGGIGLLAGAWSTGQQLASPDVTFADAAALVDRGKALDATGIALTVTGGALVIGGAVTWAVLAPRHRVPQSRDR